MDAHAGSLEELLTHSEWVRGLARRLVVDDASADDIVQDVWAAALREGSIPRAPRAWLARVVHNLVGTSRRAAMNRAAREEQASRVEAMASVEEVASRAELELELIERVHGLPEEQRAVVLLRFFEGLAPREIAQALRVPVATVHSRTARALDVLRGQLDGKFGGRQVWHLAFVPLAGARPASVMVGSALATPLIGGLVMKALGVALVASILVGTIVLWTREPGTRAAPLVDELVERDALTVVEAPAVEANTQLSKRRAVALAVEQDVVQTERLQKPVPAAAGIVVRGEVIRVDADGSEHLGYSGKGYSRIWQNGQPGHRSFEVLGGHLRFDLSEPGEFELTHMILDGLTVMPENPGERVALDGSPLLLRVVPTAVIELSVMDAVTARHLDQVELRDCTSYPAGYLLIPDMHWNRRVLQGDRSPLTLHADFQETGHKAWVRMDAG